MGNHDNKKVFQRLRYLNCSSAHRRSLAKLYSAFLLDAGLLDGAQLALELRQLSGYLAVSADKKGCGPEYYDSHAGCDLIVRPLLILGTGQLRSLRGNGLRFRPELLAGVRLIRNRRDVGRHDFG